MSNEYNNSNLDDDMQPEYDFSGKQGVRGKYYQRFRNGYTVTVHQEDGTTVQNAVRPEAIVTLDPDVREYFPDADAVNTALRGLIQLIPRQPVSSESR